MYNKRPRANSKTHPIGRVGDVEADVVEYDGRGLENGDVIVANVQQFAKDKGELYDRAKAQLSQSQVKIDLVIVDEGHHR